MKNILIFLTIGLILIILSWQNLADFNNTPTKTAFPKTQEKPTQNTQNSISQGAEPILSDPNDSVEKSDLERPRRMTPQNEVLRDAEPLPNYHKNQAPFLVQSPFASWDELHQEACEEAALIIAHLYQENTLEISPEKADQKIRKMIKFEEEELGYQLDINIAQMKNLYQKYYQKNIKIIKNPTISLIKQEIAKENIFVVPAAGRVLENPNFQTPGPLYHALVLTGYNKNTQQFITNDPGTRKGQDFKYSYENLMNSIHDFPETKNKKDILQGKKKILLIITK